MKRFLLFGFDAYYPTGGMNDFVGDFDLKEDARADANINSARDFYQILDTESGECSYLEGP